MLGDERGQAVQIGAVLLFGVLVISFASYQAFVVPSQNRGVEFNHNQEVQQGMQDLRSAILSAGQGESVPVAIPLGVRYPSRAVAINPGPTTGSLRTDGTSAAAVRAWVNNSVTTGETGDFWNGTNRSFSTGRVVYEPNYNEYTQAPTTVYENSVLYNTFRERNVTITGQQLVRDDRISLVTINGSVSVTRAGSFSLDVDPVSASTRSVSVTNPSGKRLTISVPTRLDESDWEEMLRGQTVGSGGHVVDISTTPIADSSFSLLHVQFEAGRSYELSLSRVGFGSGTTSTDPTYLTAVGGNGSRVSEGGSQRVVVEVRDRFNNPISGVTVNTSTDRAGSAVTPVSGTTNEQGRVTLTYDAPGNVDGSAKSDVVNASFTVDPASVTDFDGTTASNVTVPLTIENTDASGTSAGGAAYGISFDQPKMAQQAGLTCYPTNCTYNRAQDTDGQFNVTGVTSPTVVGATVDFGVNRTGPGDYAIEDAQTDGNGEANATISYASEGWLTTYVTSGGSGDSLTLNLTSGTLGPPLFTAVQPNPRALRDSDGEFVRIDFPGPRDTTGWTIDDEDTGGVTDITEDLSGEYYFARTPSAFVDEWGISSDRVRELGTELGNGGERIELRNESDVVVDEFAYGNRDTSEGWSLDLGTGEVANRTRAGGRYVDTNDSSDWVVESESAFFGSVGGGSAFSSVSAAAVLPRTSGQNQSFTFTPATDLPSSATVTINLDDPQQRSPRQVDYQGNAGTTVGRIRNKNTNADTASITWATPGGGVSAGTQVRVHVGTVEVGPESQQTDPYDVTVTRSDTGASATATFGVGRNTGSSELTSLSVENLVPNQNSQSQTITFEPTTDLASGEQVSIDLSVPQDAGTEVDYQNGGLTANVAYESLQFTDQNADNASIRYTAPSGGLAAGTTVEITVSGVNADAMGAAPYEVGFSRGDAGTASTTFRQNQPPEPQFTTNVQGTTGGGVIVEYDASASTDPDGTIQTYEWDIDGDGVYEESTSDPVLQDAGDNAVDQAVTLRVTDDDGETNTTTQASSRAQVTSPGFEVFGLLLAVLLGAGLRRRGYL